jgi:hypothetical protein
MLSWDEAEVSSSWRASRLKLWRFFEALWSVFANDHIERGGMEKKEKSGEKREKSFHPLPTNFVAFLTFSVAIVRVSTTLPLLLLSPYLHLFTPNYPNLYHIT